MAVPVVAYMIEPFRCIVVVPVVTYMIDPFRCIVVDQKWKMERMEKTMRMLKRLVADDEDIMEGIHSFEPLKRSSSNRFLRPEMADDEDIMEVVKTTPIHNPWWGSSHYNLEEIVKSVIGGSEPDGGRMKKKPQPGPANAQNAVAA